MACRNLRFSVLLLGVVFAASASLAADPRPIKVVAFGDSTTAPRDNIQQVYPARLPELLKAKGFQAEVINAGIGGSHTGRASDTPTYPKRHALDRFQSDVRNPHPDVVVIQFGWNDSWVLSDSPAGAPMIPRAAFRANLTYFIRTLQGDGALPIVMTLTPPHSTMADWRGALTPKSAEASRELAASLDVPLIDVWQKLTDEGKQSKIEDYLVDDVHPNDRAHELIAGWIADTIAANLKPGLSVAGGPPRGYSIPLVDLSKQIERQVVVDREPGQYLGHPTTVLLEDGRTMLCVYPKGHGKGGIVYKRSTDGGLTWSKRLPTPASWETSKEVPTLHRVIGPDGAKRVIMFSGLYPIRKAVSNDDG